MQKQLIFQDIVELLRTLILRLMKHSHFVNIDLSAVPTIDFILIVIISISTTTISSSSNNTLKQHYQSNANREAARALGIYKEHLTNAHVRTSMSIAFDNVVCGPVAEFSLGNLARNR